MRAPSLAEPAFSAAGDTSITTRFNSRFARRFVRQTGARELMEDLGGAGPEACMLGGGNPARLPEVESVYRRRLVEIAVDAAEFGRFAAAYSAPGGDSRFRAAIAESLATRYGWPVSERNIALTNGSQSAFFALFNLLAADLAASDAKPILLPLAPEYIGYADLGIGEDLLISNPAAIEELPGGLFKYHVRFEAIEALPGVAAICVSRPTNPSGNVLTMVELERLDAIARARGVPLIVDAAYGVPFPGIQFTDPGMLWNDNVILCLSLSKLGLPATRTGIVVADERVVDAVTAFNAVASLAPSSTGAIIVEPLLASGELDRLCRDVIRPFYESRAWQAVEWLQAACDGLPMRIHRPEGTFFLWLWFPGLPIKSAELYLRLKLRGVLVIPGHHFFPGLREDWPHRDECLRINCAQSPERVQAGIRVIAEEVRRAFAA